MRTANDGERLAWALIENHQIVAGWPPGHTGQTLLDLTGQMYGYHNGLTAAQLPALTAGITQHLQTDGTSLFFDGAQPDGTTNAGGIRSGTLSVIYRPIQPQLSRDVTVPGFSAHGAFITSLETATFPGVKPAKPFPLVFNDVEHPRTDYPNIFFPAGLVTVNRDFIFGQERATAVVNMGRFRPDATGDLGTEQVVRSIGLDIGYSNSADDTLPQITQVGAVKTGTGFTAFVRVTDDSGSLHHVAVLWNDGGPTWHVTDLTHGSGDLWTAPIVSSASSIFIDGEAQDGAGNVGFSFNKAVNFQSTQDTSAPSILISPPLPNATYTLDQLVNATFACSDAGAVQSCVGQSDVGRRLHRDSRGIVPAVLEALQALDHDVDRALVPDVADDSTHEPTPRAWSCRPCPSACARPSPRASPGVRGPPPASPAARSW